MTKELNTPYMRKLLAKGIKKARRQQSPNDGNMISLYCFTNKSEWHYQIEFIYDTRFFKKPYVYVYAFRPTNKQDAVDHDYFLRKEI